MSADMPQSSSQQNFCGHSYYMSASSTSAKDLPSSDCNDGETHETELQLQKWMCNQKAFHAEMMDDIMYFHWALKQPDSSNFE